MPDRILLQIDVDSLHRLLASDSLTAREISCVDSEGKQCLQKLFLQQTLVTLKQQPTD